MKKWTLEVLLYLEGLMLVHRYIPHASKQKMQLYKELFFFSHKRKLLNQQLSGSPPSM